MTWLIIRMTAWMWLRVQSFEWLMQTWFLPEWRPKVQSKAGWSQTLWEHFLPLSCMERCSASASSLSANSSGRVSSRPSAPYASRAHSGSSASDRKRVSVPVVPISSTFFFRSIVHCKEKRDLTFSAEAKNSSCEMPSGSHLVPLQHV